jgi:polysaccharide deacetylase 2 family uncharacterized protein YibQ
VKPVAPGFSPASFIFRCCALLLLGLGLVFSSCRPKEPETPKPTAPAAKRVGPAAAPRLAIIIDDLGYDRAAAEAILEMRAPLTLAVLPHLPLSAPIAEEANRRGQQVLLHLPMEASNGDAKQETILLHEGLPPKQAEQIVDGMLATVPHAIGVNNHQGSRATSDAALMEDLMQLLRGRNLFFIDSRTTPGSRAYAAARRAGVPAAYRRVFLDDVPTRDATLRRLTVAVEDARENGWSIAIGHPYPTTLEALREFLPRAASRGVRLVFASELVH